MKTKQFRYALEIFEPLYRKAFAPRLELLKEIQDKLGKVSDIYTTHTLLKGETAIRKRLHSEGKERIRAFQSYWTDAFDAPAERKAWKRLLSRPPQRQAKRPAKRQSKAAPRA